MSERNLPRRRARASLQRNSQRAALIAAHNPKINGRVLVKPGIEHPWARVSYQVAGEYDRSALSPDRYHDDDDVTDIYEELEEMTNRDRNVLVSEQWRRDDLRVDDKPPLEQRPHYKRVMRQIAQGADEGERRREIQCEVCRLGFVPPCEGETKCCGCSTWRDRA